jgi:hypothetical protein
MTILSTVACPRRVQSERLRPSGSCVGSSWHAHLANDDRPIHVLVVNDLIIRLRPAQTLREPRRPIALLVTLALRRCWPARLVVRDSSTGLFCLSRFQYLQASGDALKRQDGSAHLCDAPTEWAAGKAVTRQRLVLVVWGSCLPIAFYIGSNLLLVRVLRLRRLVSHVLTEVGFVGLRCCLHPTPENHFFGSLFFLAMPAGGRPVRQLLLGLPHRGVELRSSSGFDLVLPRLVLLLESFVVLIHLRPIVQSCSHAHRQVGSQPAGTGCPLSSHRPRLRARAAASGGLLHGMAAIESLPNGVGFQRPVALHLG